MTALDLFHQQEAHLQRVTGALASAILRFCRARLATGRSEFYANELREYVQGSQDSAPASADRVLRALRRDGILDYVVVSRKDSLYKLLRVAPAVC